MAKGQKRGNRELKKPKKPKQAAVMVVSSPFSRASDAGAKEKK